MDNYNLKKARDYFLKKTNLLKDIGAQLSSAVFPIKTLRRRGVGFYAAPGGWLVSNQHVLRYPCELPFLEVAYKNGEWMSIEFERSFHFKGNDFAAVKVRNACQSISIIGGDDEYYGSSYYFCFQDDGTSECSEVKFLKRSDDHLSSHVYECIDDDHLRSGCSGGPIVEARLCLSSDEFSWEFRVVAVIFARSDKEWKKVYATPIGPRFAEIMEVMSLENESKEYGDMYDKACKMSMPMVADRFKNRSLALLDQSKHLLMSLENADHECMPDEQLLWYDLIVKLKKSLLLRVSLKHEIGVASRKYALMIPRGVTVEILEKNMRSLLGEMRKIDRLSLKVTNSYLETKHLRLDVEGGKNKDWLLSIEDNLKYKGKRLKHKGKGLSSVFAKVKIPASQSVLKTSDNSVSGKLLSLIFVASREWTSTAVLVFSGLDPNSKNKCKVRKSKNKNIKNKCFKKSRASRNKNRKNKVGHVTNTDSLLKRYRVAESERLVTASSPFSDKFYAHPCDC